MEEFKRLVYIVKRLRSREGCAWDRAQRLSDLKRYIVEEMYELLDALDSKDIEKIKEELGDLFLLLVFFVQIFDEKNRFNVKDVLKKINEKLIQRHPHVFSSKKTKSKEEILNFWIKAKAKTKQRKTIKDRLPKSAPSLFLAYLFFKEYFCLYNSFDFFETKENLAKLVKKLSKNKNKHQKRKILTTMIKEVSKLDAYFKLNLEEAVKKNILKEAKTVRYF